LLSHFAWETIMTVSCIHIKLTVNHSNHEEDSLTRSFGFGLEHDMWGIKLLIFLFC
jgi:hypothetical protein